jgi:signal transduction histidine kinase/ActR/RegA family two-component response regulator
MAATQAHLEQGARYDVELRMRTKQGEYRWFRTRGEAFRDQGGRPTLMAGFITDIDDRERAEEALREAKENLERRVEERTAKLESAREEAERSSKAKSEFLSRMSHELRTPMNAILGFAQVLESEPLDAEQAQFVREIGTAGDHLLVLINELLDLSRIDAGRMEMVVKPVGLREVLGQAVKLVGPLLEQNRIRLLDACGGEQPVLADAVRLRQVLVNLLSNAAKYNRKGGEIRIECEARGDDRLRLKVIDTGPGIAPEKLEQLFTPFERLGAERTGVDGTGIGLALSKRLMELMGGQIGVETEPGRGAAFWVELAVAPQQGGTEAKAGPVPAGATLAGAETGRRVLYVEDNAANLRLVEAMFRRERGMALITATSGEYGLELARRHRPDVILLDIHLPGMDGYALLEALRKDEQTRDIPVIALSADAMPIDVERGLAAGFSAYLTKPVRKDDLLAAFGNAMQSLAT